MSLVLLQIFRLVFWVSLAGVVYAYCLYPPVIFVCSRLFGRRPSPPELDVAAAPRITILISALNEESVIAERIENALALDYPADRYELVIASDGSQDRTAEIVSDFAERYPDRVRLLDYAHRHGKATVLNTSMPKVRGEIVVLSDANTFFERQALTNLARWFQDPEVGVVCGKLKLVDPRSGNNVDGLYWRYETFLKECEGRLGALLGSNGAIYAIRRRNYVPIAPDTIIDDFMIPLLIRLKTGKRIVYDVEAVAYEETPAELKSEFRRRSRIGAGGFQSLVRLPALLLPRYGWTSFAFWSHKLLRWICPAFLLLAFIANLLLIRDPFSPLMLALQGTFYTTAFAGNYIPGNNPMARLLRLTTLFTSMNLALAVGFWNWMSGLQKGTWQRTAR